MLSADQATQSQRCFVRAFTPGASGANRHVSRRCLRMRASQVELRPTEEAVRLTGALRAALTPVKSCGLFGLQAAQLSEIQRLVSELELQNPLKEPTEHLELLAGEWRVIFSTIKVTGSKRVKLGLRDLVQIGTLTQEIDAGNRVAVNRVGFNVPMFGVRNGELTLKASYTVASPTRVDITLDEAGLAPERLQSVFEANFDLLLSIFNPAGWLEVTYCDSHLRCGRDDQGHLFILERIGS